MIPMSRGVHVLLATILELEPRGQEELCEPIGLISCRSLNVLERTSIVHERQMLVLADASTR